MKKEVQSLSPIKEDVAEFQKNWVRPIRSNTNSHLPFIQEFSKDVKKELNAKLSQLNEVLQNIKESQTINDKLKHYTNYLIELKLNSLRGNHTMSKTITNNFLNDDFLNLNQTINEIQSFDLHIQTLVKNYDQINQFIHREISLEETLFFMDLPHKKYLYSLIKTAEKQKKIVRHIGRHFVPLAKEVEKNNGGRK